MPGGSEAKDPENVLEKQRQKLLVSDTDGDNKISVRFFASFFHHSSFKSRCGRYQLFSRALF